MTPSEATPLSSGPRQEDHSKLARLLDPWWTAAARFVPARVAPNVVTLAGVVAVVVPTALLVVHHLAGHPPTRWLLLLQIFGIFLFQTLDAVDGKHARRTGSSSAVGSWLDHVCDIATTQVMMLGVCITVGASFGPIAWYLLAASLGVSVLLHWETAWTRVLVLEDGASITEAQLLSMGFHALPLVAGTSFWWTSAGDVVPGLAALPGVGAASIGALVLAAVTLVVSTRGMMGCVRRARLAVPAARLTSTLALPMLVLAALAALLVASDDLARLGVLLGMMAGGTWQTGHHVLDELHHRTPASATWHPLLLGLPPCALALAGPWVPSIAVLAAGLLSMLALALGIGTIATRLARTLGIPVLRLPRVATS